MSGALYLAWRYLSFHKVKTAILILAVTLIFFIPSGLQVLVDQSEAQMKARAAATPLVIGAKGSPLELVLNTLYFGRETPERILYAQAQSVAQTGLATPIPMYVRFHAGDDPIVGTTLDYAAFRGLELAEGRWMTRLGDCMVGANVARRRSLGPGDALLSSPETVFDIAGVYPLKMHVQGVLAPTGTPDDDAVFVDVKTAWVIEGLGHGHEDLARPEAAGRVLKRDGNVVIGNASVVEFNEITPENSAAFHFHGELGDFPLTAVIANPKDVKSGTILRGRYEVPGGAHQIVRPAEILDELLSTVVAIKSYVVAAFLLVGLATLAVAALVFLLSLRLRRREIETMVKIGGSKASVAAVLTSEIVLVLVASAVFAALLTWATSAFGSQAVRAWLA